jgi:hypothetical protein
MRMSIMAENIDLEPAADDQKLLAQVVAFYHETLKQSPEALAYLHKRGVTSGEAITHFRLGYADRTLGKRLPSKNSKAGRAIREHLERLGLFRASGHEHFNGSVVFPVFASDGTGWIVDVYCRKIRTDLRKGTLLDLFLSDERHGVWNVESLMASEEIILCPSIFDGLMLWSHGYRNVTCTFGPDSLTQDHLAAFREYKVRRVLVVNVGLVPQLLDAGLDVFSLQLPPGVSINAYALQAGDPAEALGSLLRKAHWLGKGQAVSIDYDHGGDDNTAHEPNGPLRARGRRNRL